MKLVASKLAIMATAGIIAHASAVQAADDVVIVYDASGSMWGQIDGTSKVEIAREVLADLVNDWDAETNLGLVAYGHRSKGDCTDIETLISPAPVDRGSFIDTVNAIRPVGKTPISASIQHAADLLAYRDNPATVVLISDGVETCNADPCALSAQLAKQGVKFTVHVVGFDLDDAAQASLSCIADNTGGMFVPAGNADELHNALAQVQDAMVVEPEPTPEPVIPEVILTAPAQVTTGATFDVAWDKTINSSDFITIVPAGADEGTRHNHIRARDDLSGKLTAPATPGLYEVRYVLDEGDRTIGVASVELVEAGVTVTAPAQVTTGAMFDVAWDKTINSSDFITIVPAGADEGTRHNHIRARDELSGKLTAPATPGLYEVRYVLDEGDRTIGMASVELVEAGVTVTAPAQVTTGATFDVAWDKTINRSDFITIVPAGADEGTRHNHIRARDDLSGKLTAPATPGLYEVRYVLDEGDRTIGMASVELIEPEMGISGPGSVRAGTQVDIQWSSAINGSDYVTIVPAGADEGTRHTHLRVRDMTEGRLKAPDETGLYEIRYVLDQGNKTLASAPLEVVDADAPLDDGAGLSAPETAAPSEVITVTWTGGGEGADQRIALALKEQPDFSWVSAQKIEAGQSMELKMPDEPGLYEVRYLDVSNRALLGRSVVEVK
ncbi:vWA domain-containing protein [Neptunicoccus sediminis]|uniref:vWA domain-containing protein n=1 Tax=Neptunicoccus sediminis TaxID=1892596 RepID=UPI00084600F9|nr:VWA domain-containing protein [Neptunicoccus sediminis]